jgi:hypothetical protein
LTTSKKSGKRYTVQLKTEAFVTVELSAPTLEDALAAARGYKVNDVLNFDTVTDIIDGSAEVTGVYES